jgi:hypothetical protein
MKLLAKTAEGRYQTAAGLERDLRRCLAAREAQRWIEEFPLGAQDVPDRLVIPEILYGREREIGHFWGRAKPNWRLGATRFWRLSARTRGSWSMSFRS